MAPDTPQGSLNALLEADRDHARQSTHGGMGTAGYISREDASQPGTFLSAPGEIAVVNLPEGGLPDFHIGVAWDNVAAEAESNPIKKLFKKTVGNKGVDLDLGCLYQMKNGLKGGLQALGNQHGSLKSEPFIALSRDERTGDKDGEDEVIIVNGSQWEQFERLLIYVYIYGGVDDWAEVRPQIQVRVPGEQPMIVTLNARRTGLDVCAVAGIENIRGGIKLTSYLEYFPGHAEMDRAFGYGLAWESGSKDE